ncbi:MAG: hypothetical protein WC369_09945 [Dehalococcoidales bacterium]
MLQNRQHECRCFAGPGLGEAHNVFTCENGRDRLHLDRRRDLVAECLDAGRYLWMKLK